MKYIRHYFWVITLAAVCVACDSETETRNPEVFTEDSLADTISQMKLSQQSTSLQQLIKSDEGVFRGVKLGMSLAEVKKLEDTTEIEEEANDHIDYMVNLKELETAEVRYIFEPNSKLSKIEINIYPNSKGSQDSLYNELITYFDAKYGTGTSSADSTRKWENKKADIFISMGKRDTQKVHDISIVLTSLMRQSALILHEALPEDH